MSSRTASGFITETTAVEYFQASVSEAMARQQVRADDDTTHYLVSLLTHFIHAENLYEETDEGPGLRPLALLYAEAVASRNAAERQAALRRLGDVALFIAGFFADSLERKAVDVDYYIAMGGGAYGFLAEDLDGTLRGRALSPVYRELAAKFTPFVDVLGEVSETMHTREQRTLLRLYELWLRTGSPRLARRLREHGIQPAPGLNTRRH
ncbi:MAG: hypothetical protein R3298_09165 [Gammaproteobacteria bacterium]|nr:hypothetical protein [Gammaproteobacteria bacterium]